MLAPVLGMLSCERENADNERAEDNMRRIRYRSSQHHPESARNQAEEVHTMPEDTGDDDEPQDDKQHWKIPTDSVPDPD